MNGNSSPVISIIAASYNHEKYIKFFIESVLQQTNPNWELIIVDDCSTDNNVTEIEKFKDKRIKLIKQKFNMGMNCALNIAFQNASGDYVVLFGTDDIMTPDFIECVSIAAERHTGVGVFYPGLQCIDEDNNTIEREIQPYNANRYDILRRLFYEQNVMTSPGMVIKRDVFKQIMPLNPGMSQHHDYQIHVKLLINSDCCIIPEKLVLYRAPNNRSGISYSTPQSRWRCNVEEKFVMDTFLMIKDVDLLIKIFGDDLKQFGKITPELIPYVLGSLAILNSKNDFKKMWGYNTVASFINNPGYYAQLNKLYGFKYSDFLKLANNFGDNIYKLKYYKYKKLFNATLTVFSIITIVLGIGVLL